MNVQTRKIVELLKKGKPEHQMAAAIVLGELRARDREAVKALGQTLGPASKQVRAACVEALGKIGSPAGLTFLMPLLEIEDADLRSRALEALSAFGPKAVSFISGRLTDSPPTVRRALVTVLSRIADKRSTDALLSLISSGHPEAARESAHALSERATGMTRAERRAIKSRVERILKAPARKAHGATLSAGLGLLGAFGDTSSAPLILKLAGPGYPETVRKEALLSVGAAIKGTMASMKIVTGIFALLTEKTPHALTTTALEVLYRMEIPKGSSTSLIKLLDARDPAVRRFAARKLGNLGGIRAARRLVALLSDSDPSLRDAVADSLSRMPESVMLLMDLLERQTDIHRAWTVAHIVKNHAQKIPAPILREHIKKTVDLLLRGERIAEPWMHVARHAGPRLLYSALMSRAARLKKARRYAEVEALLRPLLRTEEFDTSARFELALASLRASAYVEGVPPRTPDSPLDLFKQLARDPAFPFIQRIRKERGHLDSEDLYWLGFHLAEGAGEEKSIGAELLRMVAQNEGKSKLGRNARNKLKLEDLSS